MHRLLAFSLSVAWFFACASEPSVPTCRERLVEMPPPPDACLQQADGREYLQQVAAEFAEDLMSWRSGPGSAEVTLGFDAASAVETVCLGPAKGETVTARAGAAAAALQALPPGPACLSNRRLLLAWESPVVTDEQMLEAKMNCNPATFKLRNRLAQCRLNNRTCDVQTVVALERELEAILSECVLQELPLTLVVPSERTYFNFLPIDDRPPSKARALAALASCSKPADEPTLVACMQEHGWAPTR